MNNDFIDHFAREGYYQFPFLLNTAKAQQLYHTVRSTRAFDQSLFLSEQEWENSPKTQRGTNPNTGRNILENHMDLLDFVENDPQLNEYLETLLGKNFTWLYRKIVCRLPYSAMPQWVTRTLQGNPTSTLGGHIRPEYRDIAYHYDNDIHQDVLEWVRMKEREHRLVTLYVYLNDVSQDDSPLCLFPQSHTLGVTPFQHDLRHKGDNRWQYSDHRGNSIEIPMKKLLGPAGSAAIWHSCMLHGARPLAEGHSRLTLRYILLRSKDEAPCGIDLATEPKHNPENLEVSYASGPSEGSDGFIRLAPNDFLRL